MSEETLGSESRLRHTRASEQQKLALIKYFEDNPNAVCIVNGSNGDQRSKQRIWIEIAHRLNLMDGTLKSTSKWAKYWNDIIIYTKCRAKNAISGKSPNDRAPTCVDTKILEITGHEHLLKKWLACLCQTSNDYGIIAQKKKSKSDVWSIPGEDEVHRVSSSSFRSSLHEGSESEVSLSIASNKKQQSKQQTFSSSSLQKRKPHACSSSSSCAPQPPKKISRQNDFDELKDLFKEIPDALITLSNSFLTLSKAINNVARALERRND